EFRRVLFRSLRGNGGGNGTAPPDNPGTRADSAAFRPAVRARPRRGRAPSAPPEAASPPPPRGRAAGCRPRMRARGSTTNASRVPPYHETPEDESPFPQVKTPSPVARPAAAQLAPGTCEKLETSPSSAWRPRTSHAALASR